MPSGAKQPILNQAQIVPDNIFPRPGSKKWQHALNANGFLMGLALNPHGYAYLKCHLEDYSQVIPDTEFEVQYAMTSGGIVLKTPLQNFSSANPFLLIIEGEVALPNMTIYPIGCWTTL